MEIKQQLGNLLVLSSVYLESQYRIIAVATRCATSLSSALSCFIFFQSVTDVSFLHLSHVY